MEREKIDDCQLLMSCFEKVKMSQLRANDQNDVLCAIVTFMQKHLHVMNEINEQLSAINETCNIIKKRHEESEKFAKLELYGDILNTAQVAKILGVNELTVRKKCLSGKIPYYMEGSNFRFVKSELRRAMESNFTIDFRKEYKSKAS